MRFKTPLRGIHIGRKCIDGSDYEAGTGAHAHTTGHPPVGFICAESFKQFRIFIVHEIAHLAADTGHDDRWRRSVRRLGGRVPAAYKRKPRRRS